MSFRLACLVGLDSRPQRIVEWFAGSSLLRRGEQGSGLLDMLCRKSNVFDPEPTITDSVLGEEIST
jgi:hypothetical protein